MWTTMLLKQWIFLPSRVLRKDFLTRLALHLYTTVSSLSHLLFQLVQAAINATEEMPLPPQRSRKLPSRRHQPQLRLSIHQVSKYTIRYQVPKLPEKHLAQPPLARSWNRWELQRFFLIPSWRAFVPVQELDQLLLCFGNHLHLRDLCFLTWYDLCFKKFPYSNHFLPENLLVPG